MSKLNLLEELRSGSTSIRVYADRNAASEAVAKHIADLIRIKSEKGEQAILGLATGATPVQVYAELVRMHREEGLSFTNVFTFNLDEYYPMQPDSEHSYNTFMNSHLFDHIDIPRAQVNIPDGTLSADTIDEYCRAYEEKIETLGGLDLQLLGIGHTGHIGFNEPGSKPGSVTRLVSLADQTRNDAAPSFGGKDNVPTQALTMGIGTIFKAREILLMAWGENKASIVKKAVEAEVSSDVPATFLQQSDQVEFILDTGAASQLRRV